MEKTVSLKIEPIIVKLLKNHEVYSYRLEKYPDKMFYIAYRRVILDKVEKVIMLVKICNTTIC